MTDEENVGEITEIPEEKERISINDDDFIIVKLLKIIWLTISTVVGALWTVIKMTAKVPARMGLVILVVAGFALYLDAHRAPNKLPQPTVVVAEISQVTPVLLPTDTPVPTDSPIPTETLISTPNLWRAAKSYSSKSSEIEVPETGVACNQADFTIDNANRLIISQNGVEMGRIEPNNPLFVQGSRWAIFIPQGLNWGVTYLDPSSNPPRGYSENIATTGWIIDFRECITHP